MNLQDDFVPVSKSYFEKLVAERDALREELAATRREREVATADSLALMAERDRLREVAQAWLEPHSFPHTPMDVFNLADRTRSVLSPTEEDYEIRTRAAVDAERDRGTE